MEHMKNIFLTVVIPAYNEETNIRLGSLDKVHRYLNVQNYSWEVLLVDDGSTDATGRLLDSFAKDVRGFRVIHNPHQGKASTVISGMLQAKGGVVLFTDLDQATPIDQLAKVLPWFSKGFDVVIGSRSGRREGAPLTRVIMARGFMIIRSLLLGLAGITDTQCGFKGFKNAAAADIFGRLKLYGKMRKVKGSMVSAGFDVETLFLARTLGYKIKEVPVEWHYVETRRVNPIKDSFQGFLDILAILWNSLRGAYK